MIVPLPAPILAVLAAVNALTALGVINTNALVELVSWDDTVKFIQKLLTEPDEAEKYRLKLVQNWLLWKNYIKEVCKSLM